MKGMGFMKKKIFAAVTALDMASAIMSGCGNESSDKGSDNKDTTAAETTAPAETTETTAETAEQEIDYNEGLKAPVSKEKININDGFTENMYARALFNNGDTSRLAAKLKAAVKLAADKDMEAPEKAEHSTKIAFIGDSITAGSQADSENRDNDEQDHFQRIPPAGAAVIIGTSPGIIIRSVIFIQFRRDRHGGAAGRALNRFIGSLICSQIQNSLLAAVLTLADYIFKTAVFLKRYIIVSSAVLVIIALLIIGAGIRVSP